ncbi:hypothetical protein [Aneurinibacillus migulanus]|uniref:Uncharacterized protein n=1 Tax=Aneurinibacillus migulanus TaxID=47500 RepID=A0A0D1VL64_ANEMI|nr:hypothetical protein [Aneurinibacillus migulanus]KIV60299.1 hypothetical protein TS65_00495 [Aneurinibacillus migulanus]KON90503.1 hypothetical protein AF333_28910 [Aneurinibacillus migulanus]MED0894917.1 hypothetical protein [Aneurinibacillus migulanus]MED1614440.1 hypothetical protein [Aneurinibacillus migulanus]SDJ77640.1 hypothetical protein SAMN04487909_12848 [Aneurinibacillus migulanus]
MHDIPYEVEDCIVSGFVAQLNALKGLLELDEKHLKDLGRDLFISKLRDLEATLSWYEQNIKHPLNRSDDMKELLKQVNLLFEKRAAQLSPAS